MAGINFSDNINGRGRSLYLQTSSGEEDKVIVSALFDSGRLLLKEEMEIPQHTAASSLLKYVETVHISRVNEIELLYDISVKIKTVRHARSLCILGEQFLRWNLLDEAINELELSLKYKEGNGDAYKYLGIAYMRKGGIEEAIEVFKKGTELFPEYPDLWVQLGMAYLKEEGFTDAINSFEKALEINSSFDEPYFLLARTFSEMVIANRTMDKFQDKEVVKQFARENLTRVSAISERFRTQSIEQVMRLFHQNLWQEAVELMEKIWIDLPPVIDLDFDRAFYLNLMYGERGREEGSVENYVEKMEGLVKKHPEFPDLHNKLGIAYLIECRNLFNRALHQFKAASDLNPEYGESKRNFKLAKNDGKGLLLLLRAMLK
ncbi:hypothetical protein J7K93_01265 [bacterium]|nr:hypothetical protein [bacterium]